ncbi:general stress protein 69 [mine drainage metagenome]|uniref:General stress protein 69 n=1 Tax=mine drainage metagenome TaxID=410659 RepID=A0A1J5RRF6_9ZZZZ
MDTRTLGRNGPITSVLGFGCMGLSQGYGPTDEATAIRVIQRAFDFGVTLFDTAMSYGAGINERLLGRALAGRREQAVVATKFGIVRYGDGVRLDAHPGRVRSDCEASLARLGIDAIDLYYLHRADPQVPLADTIGAMARLVEAGLVRYLGVSELTVGQLEEAAAVHPIAAVQFEWSLLWREPEGNVVPTARRLGVGLVPYSPLGRGLLTGTLAGADIDTASFRREDPRFHGEHLVRNKAQVDALKTVASELGVTVGQLALAWLLAQGPDVVPIPGTRSIERVNENVGAASLVLEGDALRRIEELAPASAWSGDRRSFAVPVTRRGS